jgi:NAD(P)-dependent dehydrogenase (short-subunit alcohol dehydrogenase family)
MRFNGYSAVVTGANSGIGLATAKRLLQEGARVLAVDRNVSALGQLAVEVLQVDLVTRTGPALVVSRAVELFGSLDILVNNAGMGGARTLEASDDEFIDRVLDVNLRSLMRLTREMLPRFRAGGGSIVNLSSVYGEVGYPGTAPYAASKGAVSQLTRQLAADLGPRGIRVNAVAPGVIRTPMTQERLDNNTEYRHAMVDNTPLRLIGTAEQVAAVILFLCSPDAAYVSGQVIAVDGGWLGCRQVHVPPEANQKPR